MFFLATTGADITREIPIKYWLIFAIILTVVMFLVKKLLTKLFIPQGENEEALIWSIKNKKGK